MARYQPPVVMGTVDPTAEVRLVTIELKGVPEGYDPEKDTKWYIAVLALAFGCEYQDLAPLPGGGLGTSQQSTVLHLKARGKGPELFQKMVEHKLNFYILPRNVQFQFTEKDFEAMGIEATVRKSRAETRAVRITSGEITPAIARQLAEDEGDLKHEYLQAMSEQDLTENTQVTDEEIEQEPAQVQAIEAGPMVPPQAEQPGQEIPPVAKAFDAAAWERKRTRLERDYQDELEAILTDIQKQVVARVRMEVAAEEAPSAS
jgi:hypothetical protein